MKIKSVGRLITFALIIVLFGRLLNGCTTAPTMSPSNTSNTITTILQSATDATVYFAAITRVHLDTVFGGNGPFTVYVPTDNGFAASGLTSSVIAGMSDSALRSLLLYQTVAAGLLSQNYPAGPNGKLVTANGDSIFVTTNSSGVFINGVPALNVDILASNGVINAMPAVLFPPKGNLLQLLQYDTSFNYLVAAFARASQGSINLDTLLSNWAPYTLFAPTNNAFRAAGFMTIDDIDSANVDTLSNILLYHIVPTRVFTSDIITGQTRTTLNDSTISFTALSGSIEIQGNKNTIPANSLTENGMAHNGVLYMIDQLLLP
ncbi:MAG TPA: fasciclin domain-containing protein [Puia sp.]|nr:fasciclin domain-containing protein [Puia sp.]